MTTKNNVQKRVYLAGKMTGLPLLNYPAFTAAAARIRAKNYFCFSPHENDARYNIDPSKPISLEMRKKLILDDLTFILTDCDEVWVLPHWRGSLGVAAEIATAKSCNIPVKFMRAKRKGVNNHAAKKETRRRKRHDRDLRTTSVPDRFRERPRI
jgi:hypothetical protein